MKTLEQLHKEVVSSEEMKQKFFEAAKDRDTMAAFLKENGCSASVEEYTEYMSKQNGSELGDSEVEAVAGGKLGSAITTSIFTAGFACAVSAAISASKDGDAKKCLLAD